MRSNGVISMYEFTWTGGSRPVSSPCQGCGRHWENSFAAMPRSLDQDRAPRRVGVPRAGWGALRGNAILRAMPAPGSTVGPYKPGAPALWIGAAVAAVVGALLVLAGARVFGPRPPASAC